MAPQAVIIVGGVVITVGVALALKEYAWPPLKEFVEPKARQFAYTCRASFHNTFQSRRRASPFGTTTPHDENSQPLFSTNNHFNDDSDGDTPTTTHFRREDKSGLVTSSTDVDHPGLRRRNVGFPDAEVEMAQLNEVSKSDSTYFSTYLNSAIFPLLSIPCIPRSSCSVPDPGLPLFRVPTTKLNIFGPMSLPPSEHESEVPLHVSAPNLRSAQVDPLATFQPMSSSGSAGSASTPFDVLSWTTHPLSTEAGLNKPKDIKTTTLDMPTYPLSPPVVGSTRSAERALSPSFSEALSEISATPSRNWTDGGTADIFSGSEQDFRDQESDEDDVRSVSESGSWENISNEAGSPRLSDRGNLSR